MTYIYIEIKDEGHHTETVFSRRGTFPLHLLMK